MRYWSCRIWAIRTNRCSSTSQAPTSAGSIWRRCVAGITAPCSRRHNMKTSDIRIAPSILSADFSRLGEEVRAIEAAGADLVHFDVMDNHYAPNLTIGPLVCEAIRPHVTIPIDVHLMVEPVDALIPLFAKAGANFISFHPEASRHVDRTIGLIREHGCKAGLVLNPATPLGWLDHTLDQLDLVLLMSVNPGRSEERRVGKE